MSPSPAGTEVTVVVPAFRRGKMLARCIRSLQAQDMDPQRYEIIVVDSSPDGDNEELLKSMARQGRCSLRVYHKQPEGPGPSRNKGVEESASPFVAFLDSDCFADPGWLEKGLAAFRDGIGIVQSRTLPDPGGRNGVLTWCPERHSESFVFECTGLFYRRAAFDATGGFPADAQPLRETPLGGEDVEVAWSAKRAGWESTFAVDAVVYHEVVPLTPWQWLFMKRLLVWPRLVRRFPELRRYMVARYFWDRGQALLALALAGIALSPVSLWTLGLGAPYVLYRGGVPSRSFPGPLRPLRLLPYLARDIAWLSLLLAGSLRHRSLLL